MSQIIDDNYKAKNNSFLYFLHEEDIFDIEALNNLCLNINSLVCRNEDICRKLFFIYSQILRHIIFHFDRNDQSTIKNLPDNYVDYINELEDVIDRYINGR